MKTGKIVHILLAVSIVFYLTGHILLNNRKIQQDAAVHIVGIANSTLGTDVNAGRVQFTYPFGITIDNLTVYDLQHDTLAHAASLSLRLKPLKLLKKKLNITSVRVNSPSIRLSKEGPDSDPNYAFLTALMGNSDEPMSLRANSVLIRNGSIRYDVKSSEWTDSLFNPNHIGINGLNTNLSLKTLSADSVAVIIRKFSLSEQSGLALSKAKGAVYIGREHSDLSGLTFSTPSGKFDAARLTANFGFASELSGIPDMDIDITATFAGSDYKALFPQLAPMTTPVSVSMKANGRNGEFNLKALYVNVPDSILDLAMNSTLSADSAFIITGCHAQAHGTFSQKLPQWIKSQFSGFSINIPKQLASLGDGSFKLDLDHTDGIISSTLDLTSQAGTANCQITGQQGLCIADVIASDIDLRTITGNRDLGNCSFTARAELGRKRADQGYSGRFNGRISSLRYKRYNYRGINVNGTFQPDLIHTGLKFADRNGAVNLNATIGTGNIPFYSVRIETDSLNLSAYHLADHDSMSLTTSLTANIVGKDMDDMTGKISVDSLYYADKSGYWYMDNLTVAVGQYNEFMKVANIYSDFMNISVIGNYRMSQIPASLAKACSDALPTIGKLVSSKLHTGPYLNSTNNFAVNASLDNADFLQRVFHSPVYVNKPVHLQMTFVDSRKVYSGQLSVPEVTMDGQIITDALVNLNSSDGICKINLSGAFGQDYADLTSTKAELLAFDDNISGEYSWKNTTGSMSGDAKTFSRLIKYDRRNGIRSLSSIDTTSITVNGTIWDLSVAQITTEMRKVIISDLSARSNNQYLFANGTVSSDSSDVIMISMKNIDLGNTLSALRVKNSAKILGNASGQFIIAGVLSNPAFSGNLGIDDFQFMDSYHGRMEAECRWNRASRRVELKGSMTDEGISSTSLTGIFIPQTKYLDITLDANRTDLFFLNTWTQNIFREMGGRATGQLRLFGSLSAMDMEGQAVLEDGYFVQDAVNTTFRIKRDTLWFEPGKMLFKDVEFYDEKGHDGLLNCTLIHQKFSHWKVDMNAYVADMLVYNIPRTDKSDVFASVYAEGSMDLKFDERNGLAISVDARTAPGTSIGYNPSAGTVADYNFLTIVDRGTVSIDEETVKRIIPDKAKNNKRFSLDLNVECSEDALIEMSMSSLKGYFRGNGNISMKFTPKDGLALNGIYNLSYGQCALSIEDIIRKNFTLMEGSYVRFNGAPMDTEINLHTYHNVNSASIYDLDPSASSTSKVHARCLMDVTGYITDPRISFDVDLPSGTPEEKAVLASATTTEEQRNIQFMYLLAIGRFYTYDVAAMDDGRTPSTMESIVNSTVSGQINNVLSQMLHNEKVSISSNVSASSYLTNDATNMSNKELQGILEAHLLNNRLLINGNFGYRENTINNTSNFIGDFEFKYLLIPDKKGKGISIKGYNKSNDKYFSKTTLTTQGVGLVLEKDF